MRLVQENVRTPKCDVVQSKVWCLVKTAAKCDLRGEDSKECGQKHCEM